MFAFRLPVTHYEVVLRQPTGAEDILLAEAGTLGVRLALALVGALARGADGGPLDWSSLSVTDLDAALLRVRQLVVGDLIRSTARCPLESCAAPIDVSFRIGEYLEHQLPSPPPDIIEADRPGWFRLAEPNDVSTTLFRLPTCADLVAIATQPDGERELRRRCAEPADISDDELSRVEEAMEALAPSLFMDLDGECPKCGGAVGIPFDPQRYVLHELRRRALSIYEEVDLLASQYHWSEHEILAMTQVSRSRYAELVYERIRGD